MQTDMHYYGTYALARLAGFNVSQAEIIAYSSQFVDDSTSNDSDTHLDGGLIYGVATEHHNDQVFKSMFSNRRIKRQKQIWVPFHFLPGGEGENIAQRLVCQKDSVIAREMFENHINHAKKSVYGLHLIGIACHVYADTFSHYGFSGVSSPVNDVRKGSTKCIDVKNTEMKAFITSKLGRFMRRYGPSRIMYYWRKIASYFAITVSGGLGHAGVGTYPDRPYLHWEFTYENGEKSDRNNPETFIEGCEKIYDQLVAYGKNINPAHTPLKSFSNAKKIIEEILAEEVVKEKRINSWRKAIESGVLYQNKGKEALNYDPSAWEKEKAEFPNLSDSGDAHELNVYKFHQAATYHRYFVLKNLLPRNNIVIF